MKSWILLLLIILYSCFSDSYASEVKVERDITYSNTAAGRSNLLDIYYKKPVSNNSKVLVFIHGGSWNSGKKEMYWWLGRNFARKDVVCVIINYSLSPEMYGKIAQDCAGAVKWVKENIAAYGGDPNSIFVMGHSAGGHLAGLINFDTRYFSNLGIANPIRGVIMNDAFGLDMHEYMTNAEKDHFYRSFLKTFSADEKIWKEGSPLTYIGNAGNPHLIFVGERTYPAIVLQSNRLFELLNDTGIAEVYTIKRKKHIAMISQMVVGCNRLYKLATNFMEKHRFPS